MRADQRIVTKIPLTELWDDTGTVANKREGNLEQSRVVELLRTCPVQFIVADCGLKLEWIPTEKRFEFWKKVRSQIADPERPIYLKQFPNETAYIASQWRGQADKCLILLEKHH